MSAEASLLSHFELDDVSGLRVSYRASLWQRKYLILLTPSDDGFPPLDSNGISQLRELANDAVAVVVAASPVTGVAPSAIVIADRWGEIAKAWTVDQPGPAPSVQEIREWVTHVQMRCPECEGEAR